MRSILFVCTGNVFRSMIAEFALKAALGPGPRYHVSSAGALAVPQEIWAFVRDRLRARGIDPTDHRPRRLTPEILDAADLVIAMGLDHRDHIKECFEKDAVLFNQLCCGKEESVLDIFEAVPDWRTNERTRQRSPCRLRHRTHLQRHPRPDREHRQTL